MQIFALKMSNVFFFGPVFLNNSEPIWFCKRFPVEKADKVALN